MGAFLYQLEHQGLRVLLSMTQAGFGRAVKKIRGIFLRDISCDYVSIIHDFTHLLSEVRPPRE